MITVITQIYHNTILQTFVLTALTRLSQHTKNDLNQMQLPKIGLNEWDLAQWKWKLNMESVAIPLFW